jgi:hypothetical protein
MSNIPLQLQLRQNEMDTANQQWHELVELRSILQRDCNIIRDRAHNNIRYLTELTHHDTQDGQIRLRRAVEHEDYKTNMRQLVRAFFALVEAMIYCYKQYAVALPQSHYTFTQEERDIANEESEGKKKYLSFYENLRYSIDFLCKGVGISFKVNASLHGHAGFKLGVAMRNRLMHPKIVKDVEPELTDYEKFVDGSSWYYDQMSDLIELVNAQLQNAQVI